MNEPLSIREKGGFFSGVSFSLSCLEAQRGTPHRPTVLSYSMLAPDSFIAPFSVFAFISNALIHNTDYLQWYFGKEFIITELGQRLTVKVSSVIPFSNVYWLSEKPRPQAGNQSFQPGSGTCGSTEKALTVSP